MFSSTHFEINFKKKYDFLANKNFYKVIKALNIFFFHSEGTVNLYNNLWEISSNFIKLLFYDLTAHLIYSTFYRIQNRISPQSYFRINKHPSTPCQPYNSCQHDINGNVKGDRRDCFSPFQFQLVIKVNEWKFAAISFSLSRARLSLFIN